MHMQRNIAVRSRNIYTSSVILTAWCHFIRTHVWVKWSIFLSYVNQIWTFSAYFNTSLRYKNFKEIRPVGAALIHSDRRIWWSQQMLFATTRTRQQGDSKETSKTSWSESLKKYMSIFVTDGYCALQSDPSPASLTFLPLLKTSLEPTFREYPNINNILKMVVS